MSALCALAAVFTVASLAAADCRPLAPCYSAAGVVNAASYEAGALAPYTFASLFGENLSYNTKSGPGETRLGGVTVVVNNYAALVSYVSATQVNFVVPAVAVAGPATIQLVREGTSGPPVLIALSEYAPALFSLDARVAIAVRQPAWTVVTPEDPARGGEWLTLYATGLGRTVLPVIDYDPFQTAVAIQARNQFRLFLDDVALEDERVTYVGVAPLFPGVYQINFKLPDQPPTMPLVRIELAGRSSPPLLLLIE